MTFPRFEGLTISPGGSIQNLVVETLSANPSTPTVGRVFYNSTTRAFTGTYFNGTANVSEALLVTSSLTPVNDAITALQGQMTTAEGNITTLQGTTSAQGSAISGLTTRMTTAEDNITNLQGRMTTTEGNVSNLQGRMTTAETNISGLQTSSGNNTTAIGTLANLLTTNKTNLVSAINEVFQGPAISLVNGRTFSVTGDATGTSAAFNGTANASIPLVLASTGVAAGFYGNATTVPRIEVDEKGRILSVTPVTISGGGGGATTFIQLTDVPASYTGAGGYVVRVKADATGLEFVDLPVGTPTLQQVFAASTAPQLTVNGVSGPLTIKQSDTSPTVSFEILNSTDTSVTQVDSNGNITTAGTVDALAMSTTTTMTVGGTLIASSAQIIDKVITTNEVVTPTDANADGGGLVLRGATDKTILYTNATATWTSSENLTLAAGKTYSIGTTLVASGTAFGPLSGVAITNLNASALGSGTVPAARLPIAAAATLGAVRVGSGLSIDGSGILSVNAVATTWGSITGTLSAQTDLQAALDAKVAKTGTANQIYGTDNAGAQTTLAYATSGTAATIAQRTAQGQLQAVTVADSDGNATANDLVNRGYVAAFSGLRVTRVALANAGSYNATTDYDVVIFTGGPVASYTVNLPSNLAAYAKLQLVFEGAVTALTVAPGTKAGGGNNVIDFAPVVAKAGDTFAWGYDTSPGEWMVNSVWSGASRDFRNTAASAGNIYSSLRALDNGAVAVTMWNDARTVATDMLTIARAGAAVFSSTVAASNLSGTNTGDQTITLTGDVTGSGTGSFAATLATVNSSPVTNAFVKVTTNGKGLVTATSAVTQADITSLLGSTYVPLAGGVTMTGSLTAPSFIGPLTGNADTATALATGRTISATGDATGTSATFDGTSNASIPLVLATVNAGPVSNALVKVTTNAKGLVTATTAVAAGDLTPLLNSVYVPQGGGVPINNLTALTIGTASAMALALGATTVTPVSQVFGTSNAGSSSSTVRASADANGSAIYLAKTRGTTATDFTTVAVSDVLGNIVFDGATGTAMNEGARISSVVAAVGSGTVSARLDFATTDAGGTTPTTRMSISHQGATSITTSTALTSSGLVVNQGNTGASGQAQIQANSDTSGIALGANGSGWSTNASYGAATEAWVRSAAAAAGLYVNTGAGPLRLASVGAESARITNSRVLAGNTAELSAAIGTTTNLSSRLQVFGGTTALASANIVQGSADAVGPSIFLGKTRSATQNTLTIVQVGDDLGSINFNGAATSAMAEGARITSTVESAGSGTIGANLRFFTTLAGGTTPTVRVTVDSNGNTGFGTTLGALGTTTDDGRTYVAVRGRSGNSPGVVVLTNSGTNQGNNGIIEWRDMGNTSSSSFRTAYIYSGQDGSTANNFGGFLGLATKADGVSGAGIEVIRITGSGRVGIATTTPQAVMHVRGLGELARLETTAARGTGQDYLSFYDPTGQKGYIGYGSSVSDVMVIAQAMNDSIAFNTNATEKMRLTGDGNLGIGITAPTSKLHVSSTTTAISTLVTTGTGTNDYADIQVQSPTVLGRVTAYGANHPSRPNSMWMGTNTAHPLVIATSAAAAIYIDTSQNVGVGTTAPQARLSAGTGIGKKILSYDGGTGNAQSGLGADLFGGSSNQLALFSGSGTLTNQNIAFGFVNTTSGTATEWMRLISAGNLLINTTAAQFGSNATVCSVAKSNGNADSAFQGIAPNGAAGPIFTSQTVSTGSTGWYHFIGQTGNGTAITTNAIFIYGNGNVANVNNSYAAISDRRVKENIVDTQPKLSDLLRVRIVNYNLIADPDKRKQLGVISQELMEVFPGLVEEVTPPPINDVEQESHLEVKYSVFVPILIKSVQELAAELQTEKDANAELRNRVDQMEEKQAALETMIQTLLNKG